MPKARTVAERVSQVQQWLQYHHPPKKKVTLRWVKEIKGKYPGGDFAECVVAENLIILSRHTNRTIYLALDSLLHEWAHILRGRGESWGHDDDYWRIYGRIYRDFYDGGGHEASREY